MGERFLRNALLYSGFLLGLSLTLRAQDCPDNATFEVTHEQTPGGNDGSITVTFTGLHGNMDPKAGTFRYHLWNKNTGYVYDQGQMDPGLYIDSNITFNFRSPGTITFDKVPPRSGYVVILTSSDCQGQFHLETGEVVVEAYKQ
ncbi:MAG: hypothetical protein WA958_17410 [Tunicatimonas sp.]